MSYIVRVGNLASAPQLRQGDRGPYTFARVICSDRVKDDRGEWVDGPALAYDVAVAGNQAENLCRAAETGGNIRVLFAGDYRVTSYGTGSETRIQHEVRADEIAVSLRGQSVAATHQPATSTSPVSH